MHISCVMIVDDSEPDQFIGKYAIRQYDKNITILQAYDGEEALEVLRVSEVRPNIIFLDINMPRMDGHEFLAAYEEIKNGDTAIIIMLTSSEQKKDVDASSAYETVKGYLTKPLDGEGVAKSASALASNYPN